MAQSKFLESCRDGKFQKAKSAMNDIDVNYDGGKQFENKTALILASEHGHAQIVTLLLENNANVDGVDKYGMTALHHAAFKGHNEVCKLLIDGNADIDCYDKASLTPLHEAASAGKGGVIKILLKAGANVVLTDKNNKTALDIAKEFNRTTCIKYLSKGLEKHNKKMAKLRLKESGGNKPSKSTGNLSANNINSNTKHQQRAGTVMNLKLHDSNSKKHKKKHITETDKMKMAITQLNLFNTASDNNNGEIEQLRSQNQGLQQRVKKLQSDKEKLRKQLIEEQEDNKEVESLRSEVKELQESLKIIEDENDKQDKEIQLKDREINRLNQLLLKSKHKFEREQEKKEEEERKKKNEKKYSQMNDDDINGIINECDDDLDKLKEKLYEIMEIMKTVDAENEELKQEIDSLNKKHNKKVDALMSDYGAIRNELNDKNDKNDNESSNQRKHRRKSSKILRKTARFQKWIENDVALPQYLPNFHDNDYDRIDVVKTLTESDLKEIGITKVCL